MTKQCGCLAQRVTMAQRYGVRQPDTLTDEEKLTNKWYSVHAIIKEPCDDSEPLYEVHQFFDSKSSAYEFARALDCRAWVHLVKWRKKASTGGLRIRSHKMRGKT